MRPKRRAHWRMRVDLPPPPLADEARSLQQVQLRVHVRREDVEDEALEDRVPRPAAATLHLFADALRVVRHLQVALAGADLENDSVGLGPLGDELALHSSHAIDGFLQRRLLLELGSPRGIATSLAPLVQGEVLHVLQGLSVGQDLVVLTARALEGHVASQVCSVHGHASDNMHQRSRVLALTGGGEPPHRGLAQQLLAVIRESEARAAEGGLREPVQDEGRPRFDRHQVRQAFHCIAHGPCDGLQVLLLGVALESHVGRPPRLSACAGGSHYVLEQVHVRGFGARGVARAVDQLVLLVAEVDPPVEAKLIGQARGGNGLGPHGCGLPARHARGAALGTARRRFELGLLPALQS